MQTPLCVCWDDGKYLRRVCSLHAVGRPEKRRANTHFWLFHIIFISFMCRIQKSRARFRKSRLSLKYESPCCAEPDLPAHHAAARVEEVRILFIGVDAILAFVLAHTHIHRNKKRKDPSMCL